jgi:hypothetical protein
MLILVGLDAGLPVALSKSESPEVRGSGIGFVWVMVRVSIHFLEQRTEKVFCWSSWFWGSVGSIAK